MKFLILTSAESGSGETTLAYNLGVALERKDMHNLIISFFENPRLRSWYDDAKDSEFSAPGKPYVRFACPKDPDFTLENLAASYEYVWLLTGQTELESLEKLKEHLPDESYTFVLTTLSEAKTPERIEKLWQDLTALFGRSPLKIIPNRLQTGEWEHNSAELMDIAERVSEESLSEMLPQCNRIKELPLDHKTVWEVPVTEIRNAFAETLKVIESL